MLTIKNAENRFLNGMDVSPSECVHSGYLSLWRVRNYVVLAQISQIENEEFYVQYSSFENQQVMKDYLFEIWTDLDQEKKSQALSYYGSEADEVSADDFFNVANLLLSIGYLDWDVTEYKPNYLRAIDFNDTYERTVRR